MKKVFIFFYLLADCSGIKAQSLQYIQPDSGFAGQSLSVFISAANTVFSPASPNILGVFFQQSTTVINSTSNTVLTDTTLNANFNIPSSAPLGNYDVHVNTTNNGNLVLTGGFKIKTQKLQNIVPDSGFLGQSLNVFISAANSVFSTASPNILGVFFQQSTTVILSSSYIILTDTSLSANFNIPQSVPLGYYDVYVNTSNNGNLVLTSGFTIYLSIGIEEKDENKIIRIYPNPVGNDVQIKFKNSNDSNIEVVIYNVEGEIVYKGSYNSLSNSSLNINLADKPSGIYFLHLKCKDAILTKKFVICK